MKNPKWCSALVPTGLALLALAGCSGSASDADVRDANESPRGPVPTFDAPPVRAGGERRLTVDELQHTVPVVAGTDKKGAPIRWTTMKSGKAIDAYADNGYGSALGRPDFVTTTIEDPQPTPLYAKFARDMSIDVCDKIVNADLARAAGDTPTLWRMTKIDGTAMPAENLANTRYLVLRFLGLKATADDPLVVSLEKLRSEAETNAKMGVNVAAEGWRAVCMALFQDPAFHIN